MDDNNVDKSFSIFVGEDRTYCGQDALNTIVSELSKHIDGKYQCTVDNEQTENAGIHYALTHEMAAYGLPKNLKRAKLLQSMKLVNMD